MSRHTPGAWIFSYGQPAGKEFEGKAGEAVEETNFDIDIWGRTAQDPIRQDEWWSPLDQQDIIKWEGIWESLFLFSLGEEPYECCKFYVFILIREHSNISGRGLQKSMQVHTKHGLFGHSPLTSLSLQLRCQSTKVRITGGEEDVKGTESKKQLLRFLAFLISYTESFRGWLKTLMKKSKCVWIELIPPPTEDPSLIKLYDR